MDDAAKPSLARRAIAAVVLIVAAIVIIRLVVGFLSAIFWLVAIIALVIAVLWAVATLRGVGSGRRERRVKKPASAASAPLPSSHEDRVAAEMAKIQRELDARRRT
jgi:hypothetical protein